MVRPAGWIHRVTLFCAAFLCSAAGTMAAQDPEARAFVNPGDYSATTDANDRAAYAWSESYYVDAYLKMGEATADVSCLQEAARRLERILSHRDDRRLSGDRVGVASCYRRSPSGAYVPWVLPTWRCLIYSKYLGVSRFRDAARTVPNLPQVPDAFWAVPYAAHSARILIVMLRFVELVDRFRLRGAPFSGVRSLGSLRDELLQAALETAQVHDDLQWRPRGTEGCYVPLPDTICVADAVTFPEQPLPWNRSNSMGTVHLLLYRLTGDASHLDKATRLARAFRNGLRYQAATDAYLWIYFATETTQRLAGYSSPRWEDLSHGGSSVEFVERAHRDGVVFDTQDLR